MFAMPKVTSSMMTDVEYDKTSHELQITFTSGKTYVYSDVPQNVYREFLKADSKGSYFLGCIEGAFPYIQIRSRR